MKMTTKTQFGGE